MLTKNNLHVVDSYRFSKKEIRDFLAAFSDIDVSDVWQRSGFSLRTEWYCRNFLYRIGICRSRTKDVDLNYPQKWWEKLVYPVFGCIAYLFIK